MPTVICICSKWSSCKITVNGVQQPGQWIVALTHHDHERKDKQSQKPEQRPRTPSSSVPKCLMIPDPLTDMTFPLEYLVNMICLLGVWLHLRAGVSQSVVNTTLQAIHLIISMALQIVEVVLFSSRINVKLSNIKYLETSVLHTHTISRSQTLSVPPVVLPVSLSIWVLSLTNVSGRNIQDHNYAIQIYGSVKTHPKDWKWCHNTSTLPNHLIPGFIFFYHGQ